VKEWIWPSPLEGPDVVVVQGEIDVATASLLSDAIEVLRGTVTLDLSGVTFMDSSGVRVLLQQHQRREDAGDRLVLAELSQPVRRVLEVAGVLEYLGLASDDVATAN
jgi:anti-sigma B factor antagonist